MENKDFAVFILTHGRPDNVKTLPTLKKCGYTGPVYFIVDNEDKSIGKYIKNFGCDAVRVFNKKAMADLVDEGNNFDERRTITHARNACFEIAKDLGITYFIQFDDDYNGFQYKLVINDKEIRKDVKGLDDILYNMLSYYKSISAKSIAFAQEGDFLGGIDNGHGVYRFSKRKCMNSFICSTERVFRFVGAMNEDVNTYTTKGSRGYLFLTIPFIALNQAATQSQKGGISDMYLRYGTYCKAFTTEMMHPSGVSVAMMRSGNARLHHTIKWENTVPVIISGSHKKSTQRITEDDLWPDETFKSENIIIRHKDIQPVPEQISAARAEFEKEEQPELIPVPVELFTEPAKPPYTGLYSVSWTYDIFEQEKCVGKPRFTGTYSECEIFIIESKQPTLF